MYVESGRNPHPQGHYTNESQKLHKNMGHTELKRHAQLRRYAKKKDIIGELLYIMRPVIYVFCILKYSFGKNVNSNRKWRPFVIAALCDLYSYVIYMSGNPTLRQRQELSRRRFQWLFYLLRSPFFEKFIQNPTDLWTNNLKRNNATIRYWIIS